MMWGPTQNGPMTHFVPRVMAEEKTVLMWEHWNQSDSPKSASPTSHTHTQEGQSSPYPQTFQNYIKIEQGGRTRSHCISEENWTSHWDQVKTNYDNWNISVYDWATSTSLYFRHFPLRQRKPPIESEMLFTSTSLWLRSDVTVAISSGCPHTHTHTQMSR